MLRRRRASIQSCFCAILVATRDELDREHIEELRQTADSRGTVRSSRVAGSALTVRTTYLGVTGRTKYIVLRSRKVQVGALTVQYVTEIQKEQMAERAMNV